MDNFAKTYLEVVEQFCGPYNPQWGFSPEEIAEAESRIGVKLPQALRYVYEKVGRHKRLNKHHDRLLEPNPTKSSSWRDGEALRVCNDHIVFYEENQCVTFWSFRTDEVETDPPVHFSNDPDGESVEQWGCTLSEFLLFQLHWQLANGAADYGGIADISESAFEHIQQNYTAVLKNNDAEVYYKPGITIVVLADDNAAEGLVMHCGTRTEDLFEQVDQELEPEDWENWSPELAGI